jgi:hypothetical protein
MDLVPTSSVTLEQVYQISATMNSSSNSVSSAHKIVLLVTTERVRVKEKEKLVFWEKVTDTAGVLFKDVMFEMFLFYICSLG